MELTKKYLNKRIEQIIEDLHFYELEAIKADAKDRYYIIGLNNDINRCNGLLQELKTLKDLFDEEYKERQKAFTTINNKLDGVIEIAKLK